MSHILDTRASETKIPFNYGEHQERLATMSTSGDGSFNIAFFSDTHVGNYAYRHTDAMGVNLREKDGDNAVNAIVDDICNTPNVHAVLHGGDFWHFSKPTIRSQMVMKCALNKFAQHGIPFHGQAGNHDVSDDRSEMTAVALLDDEYRHTHALWTPYQVYRISDDIYLHSVSHHGLKGEEAPVVTPVAGAINIFSTHGSAVDPKNATLMNCVSNSGGGREQFIPPEMIVDDNFHAKLLGHYHERYAIGGGLFNAWYGGSTFRRGFSDNEGARGWMLVKIFPDGHVEVENKNIRQRPQYDLPVINAMNMEAFDLQDLIEHNMSTTGVTDSEFFDENEAPIVRQVVTNASRSIRRGLDHRRFNLLSKNMLHWDPKIKSPEDTEKESAEDSTSVKVEDPSLVQAKKGVQNSSGTVGFFDSWIENSQTLQRVPAAKREHIKVSARKHLEIAEKQRGN